MKKLIFLLFLNFNLLFGIFLICLSIYLIRYFGEVSFTQILFHLNFSNNILYDSDEYIIIKFFQICIYLPILICVFINSIIFIFYRKISRKTKYNFISNKIIIQSSLIFLIIASIYFVNNIKIGNIKSNSFDVILDYYEDPKHYDYNFENSKNLVLIYVESFENIFSEKSLFDEDLLINFKEEPFNKIEFKKLEQTTLTNWTIASIVASQCGLPLKNVGIFSFGKRKGKHNKEVFGMKQFLPNATCLGDILKKGNYKNIFVSSPNLRFSRTGNFFKNHGYDEVYGKKKFDLLGLNYNGRSWGDGPNDSFLFEFSKKKIDDLIFKEKFNITILTTDTHEPDGYLDPNCKLKNKNIKSVVKCTTKELYKFTKYLKDNYGDKINIVIIGDHQFRFKNNSTYNNFDRTIFNRFISDDEKKIYRNKLNFYDLFPTIVDFTNIKYNGSKLGIGVSGFQDFNYNEYIKRHKIIDKNILNRSKYYETFWKN